jgi:hypothetical protein
MASNIVHGITVLAYPTFDPLSAWQCSLFVERSKTRQEATISLQSLIPIHGYDVPPTLILSYEPDNLVPSENSLNSAKTIPVPQDQLEKIIRQGKPQLTILSMSLKKPCAIWCPPSFGPIKPKDGVEDIYYKFVKLAAATKVHVLFDHKWVQQSKYEQLLGIISYPEKWAGFRSSQGFTKLKRLADCSDFSQVKDAGSEAPPPYTAASVKPPRQGEFLRT